MGERGKKARTLSVVEGEQIKWASEEKRGETVSVIGGKRKKRTPTLGVTQCDTV